MLFIITRQIIGGFQDWLWLIHELKFEFDIKENMLKKGFIFWCVGWACLLSFAVVLFCLSSIIIKVLSCLLIPSKADLPACKVYDIILFNRWRLEESDFDFSIPMIIWVCFPRQWIRMMMMLFGDDPFLVLMLWFAELVFYKVCNLL